MAYGVGLCRHSGSGMEVVDDVGDSDVLEVGRRVDVAPCCSLRSVDDGIVVESCCRLERGVDVLVR